MLARTRAVANLNPGLCKHLWALPSQVIFGFGRYWILRFLTFPVGCESSIILRIWTWAHVTALLDQSRLALRRSTVARQIPRKNNVRVQPAPTRCWWCWWCYWWWSWSWCGGGVCGGALAGHQSSSNQWWTANFLSESAVSMKKSLISRLIVEVQNT